MLHFILPEVFFSSRSHHSFCASDIAWVGCSQVDAVMMVCAPAGRAANAAALIAKSMCFFIRVLLGMDGHQCKPRALRPRSRLTRIHQLSGRAIVRRRTRIDARGLKAQRALPII